MYWWRDNRCMINNKIPEQTLALAGLYQSCDVVSKIAWNGNYNENELLPLINSIQAIESNNVEQIYLSTQSLKTGLLYLRKQIIGDIFNRSSETRRYIKSLQILSEKVLDSHETISTIQILIKEMQDDSNIVTTDDKAKRLSDIYQETLSLFEPRIVINGENMYLTVPIQASRIRTALFAGVRSTILWRQLGGSKLKLLLFKSSYSKQIDQYIDLMKN
ncbi:MAG: hypothetical protein CMD43_04785 [Gammaproteobacteria bacterium]|nr:hypothetical protein [Gammaproteobacteria bacterium]